MTDLALISQSLLWIRRNVPAANGIGQNDTPRDALIWMCASLASERIRETETVRSMAHMLMDGCKPFNLAHVRDELHYISMDENENEQWDNVEAHLMKWFHVEESK